MTDKPDPERIWLSPACDLDAHYGEGRTWANPAPETACEDCGLPWVEYVRADLPRPIPSPQAVERVARTIAEHKGYATCGDYSGYSPQRASLFAAFATPEQPDAVAQIVAWLRELDNPADPWQLAAVIEHGDHLAALRPSEQSPTVEAGMVEKLERLAEQATPAPWGTGHRFEQNYLYGNVQPDGRGEHLACLSSVSDDGLGGDTYSLDEGSESAANAALIVALRNNVPAILTSLRRYPGDCRPDLTPPAT